MLLLGMIRKRKEHINYQKQFDPKDSIQQANSNTIFDRSGYLIMQPQLLFTEWNLGLDAWI